MPNKPTLTQKQKKAAQVYHRERMFLMLMDEFKKSREHRFSIADVRLVLRECLHHWQVSEIHLAGVRP